MAGRGGASAAAPLLEKTAAAAESGGGCCYVDGCPGCAVDRHKAANPGIPYGNFIYVWIVTLCTGNVLRCHGVSSVSFLPHRTYLSRVPCPCPCPCHASGPPARAQPVFSSSPAAGASNPRPLARTVASVVRAASCMLWSVRSGSARPPPPPLLLLIPDPLVPGGVRNVRDTARPNQTGPGGICASSPPTPTCTSVSA
jgi:hypothetical protein